MQIASLNVSLLSELFVRFSSHRSSKRLLITSRISENILSESSVASSRKCFWRGFLLPHPDVDVPCISVGCLVPYFLSNIAFTLAHVISGEVLGKVNPFHMRICTFLGPSGTAQVTTSYIPAFEVPAVFSIGSRPNEHHQAICR